MAGKRSAGSRVAGNGGVGMRGFGHGTDEFGSLLGASREPPKEGGDGDGGQQGTFSEPHGHILFVRADFSMETPAGRCLSPFTQSHCLSCLRKVSILYRQKSLSEKLWCELRRRGGGIIVKPTLMRPKTIKLLVQGFNVRLGGADQIVSAKTKDAEMKA